ncbi:MAG TPA: hypothetical protein VM659_21465 [Dongiaceae bacterium]|nr:hypothetical protein [Dongiaceae bacterium]
MTPNGGGRDLATGRFAEAPLATVELNERLRWWLFAAVYLLAILVTVRLRWNSPLNHDVAWLMVAAEKWLDGARYGSGIVEINTPAAMLLYSPAVWLGRLTGIPASHFVDLSLALVALCAAILVGRSTAQIAGAPALTRRALLSTALVYAVLAFYPAGDFAQRDHFIATLLLPYAVMRMNAAQASCHRADRVAAAIAAAIALCIKPQYLVILLAILAIDLKRHMHRYRDSRRAWQETLWVSDLPLIIAIGLLYIGTVYLAFPDWLTMVWHLRPFYGIYSSPFYEIAERASLYLIPMGIAATAVCFPLPERGYLRDGLLLAGATVLLVFLERSPWSYHFLPIVLFLFTGAVLTFLGSLPALARLSRWPAALGAAIALIPITLAAQSTQANLADRQMIDSTLLAPNLHQLAKRGDNVAFLSIAITPAFPLVVEEGYGWALRYPCLWPLAGAVALRGNGNLSDEKIQAVVQDLGSAVAQDIDHNRPSVILVDYRPFPPQFPDGIDLLALLLQNPDFKHRWQGYRLQRMVGSIAIYGRADISSQTP